MTATNNRHPMKPSLIEHKGINFLIINRPTAAMLPQFIKVCCYNSSIALLIMVFLFCFSLSSTVVSKG